MKVGSKETLECRAYSSRGMIRTTTYGHTSLMYGIGWFEIIARSTPPRRCGEEKATHIPTFRCFRRQSFNHDVPLRCAQSPIFNFQIEKPDRKRSPLLPILPYSKAETRCVHGMGASRRRGPHDEIKLYFYISKTVVVHFFDAMPNQHLVAISRSSGAHETHLIGRRQNVWFRVQSWNL